MNTPLSPAEPSSPDARVDEFVDTVRIARPKHDLYAFWRDFGNLPRFMEKVRKVTEVDSLSSIWTVAAGDGQSADWEFIVTDDEADRLIAWSASGHTPVNYSGRVEFKEALTADASAATDVTATVRYEAQGLIDALIPHDPAVQTRSDLLRFKEVMERAPAEASALPDPSARP